MSPRLKLISLAFAWPIHLFQPCRPAFGETEGRTFDVVDGWLSKAGRF
jgi:hypothetical protein